MKKHRFYRTFIEPRNSDPNTRNQEVVLNWLLVGSLGLAAVAFINELFSFLILNDAYLLARLAVIGGFILFFGSLLVLSRRQKRQVLSSIALLAVLFAAGLWVVYEWGILAPTGILLFSLVIVMAGILLSARFSLYVALLTTAVLAALEYAKAHHHIKPNLDWQLRPSSFTDVAGFTAIYAIIALVTWLFNRQMEMALGRAWRSEKALQRQKAGLEIKVEQRAKQLEANQLEKMQEIYRFAELGRLSTALFHDLANHLSSVSLDIEGLGAKNQSDIRRRISQNIGHIDGIVQRVRRQIGGKSSIEVFTITEQIDEVLKILEPAAEQAEVTVHVETDASIKPNLRYKGDIIRFRQVILNLVCNAIEAYPEPSEKTENRLVVIALERQHTIVSIRVTDHGRHISPSEQAKIFRPFYTTKEKGAGIGLFLVQQIVEQDFNGVIGVTSSKRATTFTVKLPRSYYARRSAS